MIIYIFIKYIFTISFIYYIIVLLKNSFQCEIKVNYILYIYICNYIMFNWLLHELGTVFKMLPEIEAVSEIKLEINDLAL